MRSAEALCGPLDALVSCAAFFDLVRLQDLSPKRIEETVRLNATFPMLACRALVPRMKKRGSGHFIHIASLVGIQPMPDHQVYSATKHALTAFGKSLDIELSGTGIRTTIIFPTGVRTPMGSTSRPSAARRACVSSRARRGRAAHPGSRRPRAPPRAPGVLGAPVRSIGQDLPLPREARHAPPHQANPRPEPLRPLFPGQSRVTTFPSFRHALRLLLLAAPALPLFPDALLVPMDAGQRDHLKVYGIAWLSVKGALPTSWLLTHRGGSFLLPDNPALASSAVRRGHPGAAFRTRAFPDRSEIAGRNAAEIKLEKPPRIAVYTPPNQNPWADAVTLVLDNAEIPYDKVYDREAVTGSSRTTTGSTCTTADFHRPIREVLRESPPGRLVPGKSRPVGAGGPQPGFRDRSTPENRRALAKSIQKAVGDGLFLFAMCAATETLDVALATQDTDIAPPEDPLTAVWAAKLHADACFAFEKFIPSVSAWKTASPTSISTR